MVADTLSKKSLHIFALMIKEEEMLEKFINLSLSIMLELNKICLNQLIVVNNLRKDAIKAQRIDLLF